MIALCVFFADSLYIFFNGIIVVIQILNINGRYFLISFLSQTIVIKNLPATAFAPKDIDIFMFGDILIPLMMKIAADNNITSNEIPVDLNSNLRHNCSV